MGAVSDAAADPVRARRARIARWVELGQRVGYGLFGLAIVVFWVGVAAGFDGVLPATVATCLVLGSFVLAPSIVLGYAVKAAEREDRERGV
jgi:apolipoprotein N-acyltransferase